MHKESYSVTEFCHAHGLCRATFYNLRRQGLAPRSFTVGKRRLISQEASAEWRKQLESNPNVAHRTPSAHKDMPAPYLTDQQGGAAC